jgi:hypothetical protein
MNGSTFSRRSIMITIFLQRIIFMEPLNLFLYTWRFIKQLRLEESRKYLALFLKWLEIVSIVVLPLGFILVLPPYFYMSGLKNFENTRPSDFSHL